MEASEAIRVSGLLRVVLSEEAVSERLRERPDWRDGLYRRLVHLRDPFPSDGEFLVRRPNDAGAVRDAVPAIPRLGRIGTTYLNVGGIEVHIKDGGGDERARSVRPGLPGRRARR